MRDICNFEALAGEKTLEALKNEFHYQMELTEGKYVFWLESKFMECNLDPATNAESQAILQFFANCACPFSSLRLARSMSKRNVEHGPIVSDEAALHYLLTGIEQLAAGLYDPKINSGILLYLRSNEFLLACQLLATYQNEFKGETLCPEVKVLIAILSSHSNDMIQQ
ncbi:hypothetical protein QTP81_15020 [Alteromonas sp. ASW11-36]|uniref:Uncharacterized protein n=1 Tax=Alteromonas arenosi TaxID=3055817 RepID=A0ABT7T0E5_9ALTE|nr:hypothetical protein [Alteromonas sp. ASW11-36]MDM7861913.1 hypothetical protein [Alteromonas sp. ASW11-36]